jgi:hypothetical protein
VWSGEGGEEWVEEKRSGKEKRRKEEDGIKRKVRNSQVALV